MRTLSLITFVVLGLSACGDKAVVQNPLNSSQPSNKPILQPAGAVDPVESPMPMPAAAKDGTYKGHGTVTRVSYDIGEIEIDHDDIPGLMPAMKMKFHVKDSSILKGIFAPDEVNFVIEYKHPEEKIVSITKIKKPKKDDE